MVAEIVTRIVTLITTVEVVAGLTVHRIEEEAGVAIVRARTVPVDAVVVVVVLTIPTAPRDVADLHRVKEDLTNVDVGKASRVFHCLFGTLGQT
jgi:hypothetical protein